MKKAKVLNAGAIELIDIMGDEQSIVDAARVSIAGENVKAVSSNTALIRYLLRNKHTSPFEMVELKFRVKCPIFVARQWMRHRCWSYNEVSARYSELPEETWEPELMGHNFDWRLQSKDNKQASKYGENWNTQIDNAYLKTTNDCWSWYKDRLSEGYAREQARAVLPVATYTTFIAKTDLHNLLHFVRLRNHPHAQKEIRDYAQVISDWVKEEFPNVWQAFEDYEVKSITLTACDLEFIRHGDIGVFPTKREAKECLKKLKHFGDYQPRHTVPKEYDEDM